MIPLLLVVLFSFSFPIEYLESYPAIFRYAIAVGSLSWLENLN